MRKLSTWLLMLLVAGLLACGPSSKKEAASADESVAASEKSPTKEPAEAAKVEPAEEPAPDPKLVEVKEDEVPKGSPEAVSSTAQLADEAGVALVPTDGPISDDVLNLFMSQVMPVSTWVGMAYQAPKVPEADGKPIQDLLSQLAQDRQSIDEKRGTIRARVQAILRTGRTAEPPKGKPVSRGLPSLTPLIPALDAAKVTVFPKPSPLLGGSDQGMAVAALSLVFAAKVADAIVKRDGTEAYLWARRMARFGAQAATQARTLGELSGAVMAVQDALALQEVASRSMVAVLSDGATGSTGDLRLPRRRLGAWAASLARVGKLMRTPVDVTLWERIARGQPDPVWRYEAFKGLFMHAAFHKGTPDSDKARAALEGLANDPGKGLAEIAAHWMNRLNKVP